MRVTASRTSSMACDMSVLNSNSMNVCELPVLMLELMRSMPTRVETASSILRVISVSICERRRARIADVDEDVGER